MKDYLIAHVKTIDQPIQAQNVAREYLQARILGILQRAGAMLALAFQGGTCLRFLFSIPRYSEDLDFALEGDASHYDFHNYLRTIQSELKREGYDVSLRVNDKRVVHSAFVRFAGLLHDLGLSPHPEATLSIKLEVDTRPPAGAVLSVSLVRKYETLRLQHHNQASLFAGKLHALLQRPYAKGRDIYDLIWYLSDPNWPMPNLNLLNHALAQTGWTDAPLKPNTWRMAIRNKVQALHWNDVLNDVRPFLERDTDLALLTYENVRLVLEKSDEPHP